MEKWGLLRVPAFLSQNQEDAFSSGPVNIGGRAENKPASCKTPIHLAEKKNAAAAGPRNGAECVCEAGQLPKEYSPDWAARHPIIALHFLGVAA